MRAARIILAATALAATATWSAMTAADEPHAHRASVSAVTVVGTSDVFDSGLITNVIKPGFERAYPQYRLDYVSKGTGAAIQFAEQGAASGLLVHAATLENQFVAQGYSLERFGRAVFYGDYVLLGPASDPAGVARRAPHDIVGAFELIARAGAAGRADFVSRGGTPGTTVEEHQIWALTRGVALCEVSMADGGGRAPSGTERSVPDAPRRAAVVPRHGADPGTEHPERRGLQLWARRGLLRPDRSWNVRVSGVAAPAADRASDRHPRQRAIGRAAGRPSS